VRSPRHRRLESIARAAECVNRATAVQSDLERFLALVRRELGAEETRVLSTGELAEDDACALHSHLADDRVLVARFALPPPDREIKQRRLDILSDTFDSLAAEALDPRKERPPVANELHEALVVLCSRAAAVNAIVIDANSPVVWGAAFAEGVVAQPPLASSPRVSETPANEDGGGEPRMVHLSKRALFAVRGMPELAALRKGKHVRHLASAGEAPFVAHSFAGIYLLVVIFDGAFDELRAERAVLDALPRVERLVLALPPLEPQPPTTEAGVIALRRSRRR
jgi:hypothetical protein